ncbi:hypothetical protein [Chimaeribacter californicus]|uniref:hypothetical protein n=1 Tax=Chimaeribacter californicus TaxID=2060067 RepID=UPI0011AF6972|nr:hypothetical protein [Chimaeribacter californicus]
MLKPLNQLISHIYNYIFPIYKTGLKRHFNHKSGSKAKICGCVAKVFPAGADIRDICSQRGNHYDEPPHNLAWHFYLLCSVLGIGLLPVLTPPPENRAGRVITQVFASAMFRRGYRDDGGRHSFSEVAK